METVSAYGLDTVPIKLDQRDGTLTCGGSARSGSCIAVARSGSEVAVDIVGGIPDLLDGSITVTSLHTDELNKITSVLFPGGLTPKITPPGGAAVAKAMLPSSGTLDKAYARLRKDLHSIHDVIY